jgi:protein O-GlcNAc transferase
MKHRRPPAASSVQFDRAVALQKAGQLTDAEKVYRAVLQSSPKHAGALSNLSVLLRRTGRLNEALGLLERSVQYFPHDVSSWSNLTNVYLDLGRIADAVGAGQKAVECGPGLPKPLCNLGWALWRANRFEEARLSLEAALALDPRDPLVWNNLGNVHQRQCRIDKAIEAYRMALDCDPGFSMAMQNIAFCMHFSDRYEPQEIAEQHFAWANMFERGENPALPKAIRRREPSRPLRRIGFVSPDLRDHPVSMFFRPLVENWPRERLALVLYSDVKAPDKTTAWYRGQADIWCDSSGLSNPQLADRVRRDEIDILIDLCGHTSGNRLLMMPLRAAPVQASWLGYFDTSGLRSVDYLIADAVCVQAGDETRFSETVVKLPFDFVCYSAPTRAPEVGPLPFDLTGTFTFGSQNQLVKVTDRVVKLWSRILLRVPHSRLLLAGKAFNDSTTQDRYRSLFAAEGIPASRLILKRGTSQEGVLSAYNELDLALDPFPCAGGTTTCEALYMGVPVVSLFGKTFAGRHSAAHLIAAGLPQFVTHNEEEYEDLAVSISKAPDSLRQLRRTLRQLLPNTPLMDGARFADYFEQALVLMWNRSINGSSST